MMDYTVQSPVLLLIFNRPDTSFLVFEQIKKVRPSRLYIAADGARKGVATDEILCREARNIIHKIDWNCHLKTLFNPENKGCKIAVSDAISWFFSQEKEGIILEDDCLPDSSFFYFCDTMLEKYRYDERIHTITGTNLQKGHQRGQDSYYFSQYSNVWGWASWHRVWEKYDRNLNQFDEKEVAGQLEKIFADRFLIMDWVDNFKKLKSGRIDTWDHQLNFLTFFDNALCITPNVNLISNIGFRSDATHTVNTSNQHANLPVGQLWNIVHPKYFLPCKEADYFFLEKEHHLKERWRIYNKPKNRFRRWIKRLFK